MSGRDKVSSVEILAPPPHSNEAEQSVLGGLLLDNGAFARLNGLKAADFFRHEHRQIFTAIASLIEDGKPADVVTAHEVLQRMRAADDCGGLAYLTALSQSVPSAANMRRYAEIVGEAATLRLIIGRCDEIRSAAFNGAAADALMRSARVQFDDMAARDSKQQIQPLDLAAAVDDDEDPQRWLWGVYLPRGLLTLLSGHGGHGKSWLALMLAVCVALGLELLGRMIERARVVFYSAEDDRRIVLRRLRVICRALGVRVADVVGWLFIVDATDAEPLFEALDARSGGPTPAYHDLAALVRRFEPGLLIIDNAADVFDGDEIKRRQVRAFARSLVQLVRPIDAAVLLLLHVDKASARNGAKGVSGESYSGSTAWHNAARSRLYLVQLDEPGSLELRHEKWTATPRPEDPVRIDWLRDSMMQRADTGGGIVHAIEGRNNTRAILKLLCEFHDRGEFISTADTGRSCASAKLAGQRGYPKGMEPRDVFNVLRDAERAGYVKREAYKGSDRKARERFAPTPEGRALA